MSDAVPRHPPTPLEIAVRDELDRRGNLYRSILARHDNPLPGDAHAMLDLLPSLGYTLADLSAHIACHRFGGGQPR